MTPNDVLYAAAIRALILALIATLGAIGTALANTDDPRLIVSAGLVAFSTAFVARMLEGGYDANRSRIGDVSKADIGSTSTTVVVSSPISAAPVTITQPPAPGA